ncbi:hypothetical protein K474DRAFT_1712788 [Panus rudis PR-1116 ss-1]|nr:hypothetical protein K474DRAFT_1712788 [Panus rudis PR-1116 ss-1]
MSSTGSRLPPPPERPQIFVERVPSPPANEPPSASHDTSLLSSAGVEIMVYGLDCSSTTSAVADLRGKLGAILQNDSNATMVMNALEIRQADTQRAMDHAYITVNPMASRSPRPDILETVRRLLNDLDGIGAMWRPSSGPDKTRRLVFHAGDKADAEKLMTQLREWFSEKKYAFYWSYTSQLPHAPWRVTFDFFNPAHVKDICDRPPIIDQETRIPSRPRFILSIYGLEVAILGCSDWSNVEEAMNGYIRKRYGDDAVAFSRTANQGAAYCVVLKDAKTTDLFLKDDHTHLEKPPGMIGIIAV